MHNSGISFQGIANALDLTDRILPRLQARPKCKYLLANQLIFISHVIYVFLFSQ